MAKSRLGSSNHIEIKGFTTQHTDLFDEDSTTKPHFPTDTKKKNMFFLKRMTFLPHVFL